MLRVKTLCLSPEPFGNPQGKPIYLVFDEKKKHFFLAKLYYPVQPVPNISSGSPAALVTASNSVAVMGDPSPPRVRLEDFFSGMDAEVDDSLIEYHLDDPDDPLDSFDDVVEPDFWQ